jgi:predicted RNA-binding Zn-ribbon protein involved in translation (DUF1610 family)
VSYASGPHLPVEVDSDAAKYPAVPCELQASSIKKSLAVLHVQLDTYVSNACVQVSNAPDRACKMCGQAAVNACKTCRQTAIVQLQYSASTMDHYSAK